MDELAGAVLDKINALGSPGRNIVIYGDELSVNLPDGGRASDGDIARVLKSLAAEGYIDIKYSCGGIYCLTPLKPRPESLPPTPPTPPPPAQAATPTQKSPNIFMIFLCSFLGSALAGAIFTVINLCLC